MKKVKLGCTNCLDAANGILTENVFEVQVNKEHLTVPNQSYTVREILERFTHGVIDPIGLDPSFDENGDFETDVRLRTRGFDLADASAMKRELIQKMEEEERAKLEAQSEVTIVDEQKPKNEQETQSPSS